MPRHSIYLVGCLLTLDDQNYLQKCNLRTSRQMSLFVNEFKIHFL